MVSLQSLSGESISIEPHFLTGTSTVCEHRARLFFSFICRAIFCNIEQTSIWPRVFLVSKKLTGMDDRCEGINGYKEGEKRRKGKEWTTRYLNSRHIRRASNPKRNKRIFLGDRTRNVHYIEKNWKCGNTQNWEIPNVWREFSWD